MKKRISILLTLLLIATMSIAQSEDEIVVGNHLIKIILVDDERYGYEIYENDQLVIRQATRPYINRNQGFIVKENALKLAKFHLSVLAEKDKSLLYQLSNAKNLGVSDEDL